MSHRRLDARRIVTAWTLGPLLLSGCGAGGAAERGGGAEAGAGTTPAAAAAEEEAAIAEGDLLAASESRPMELGREPVTVEVPLTEDARRRLRSADPERLRLAVEEVRLLRPGVHYKVFLDVAETAAAGPGVPHFLGHLALFAEPGTETTRTFDLAGAVRAHGLRGAWPGRVLRVSFVPDEQALGEGGAAAGPFFRIGRVAVLER